MSLPDKKSIFAILAVTLMITATGCVLFANDNYSSGADPVETDKIVALGNGTDPSENLDLIGGEDKYTVDTTNRIGYLTLDNVNLTTTAIKAILFNKSGLDSIVITVVGENVISVNYQQSDTSNCYGMEFYTDKDVLIKGTEGSKLTINMNTQATAYGMGEMGINNSRDLIIDGVELNINLGDCSVMPNGPPSGQGCGACGLYSQYDITISNSDVSITVGDVTCTTTPGGTEGKGNVAGMMALNEMIINSSLTMNIGAINEKGQTGDGSAAFSQNPVSSAVSFNVKMYNCDLDISAKDVVLPDRCTEFISQTTLKGSTTGPEGELVDTTTLKGYKYIEGTHTGGGGGSTAKHVTYSLAGGQGTVPTQEDVKTGETFQVADCTATLEGYKFVGWYDGTNTYKGGSTYTVGEKDVTLIAVWEAITPEPEPEPTVQSSSDNGIAFAAIVIVAILALLGVALIGRR